MGLANMSALGRLLGSRMAMFAMAYAGTAALQKGIGFILFLWVARTLGVTEYALFGLLFALQTALTSFATAGIVESAIGLLREYPGTSLRQRLYGAVNSAFGVLAVGAALFAAIISVVFLRGSAASLAAIASVLVSGLAAAYVAIQASLVRLEERHPPALALGFFVPTAAMVGGGLGLLWYGTVSSFYVGSAIASTLALVPFVLGGVGHHRFVGDRLEVIRVLAIVAPFMLIAMLTWLSGYGSTYLVELFFDADEVARFTFVYTVSAVMQLVATALNQAWSPRFYALVHASPAEEVDRRTRHFTIAQGSALGAIGAVLLLIYTPALDLVGGNLVRYRDLRVELMVLFLAYAVSIPWWHAQNYFYAHGKGRELMRISIWSSLCGLAAWVACAYAFGVIGVFLGFFAQMLARAAFAFAWARREWRIHVAWEGPLIAASAMAGAAGLAGWLFGADR